jgi:peptide deformylase
MQVDSHATAVPKTRQGWGAQRSTAVESEGGDMTVRPVLQLGNPDLYEPSSAVLPADVPALLPVAEDLRDTLRDFRRVWDAGRAIAAPQIGVRKRLIWLDVPEPVALFNPVLSLPSERLMEVWDDCLCFPDLLVRVLRHESCTLTFHDRDWHQQSQRLAGPLSELLQHEVDHLDGVLAVARAIDGRSFALRRGRVPLSND